MVVTGGGRGIGAAISLRAAAMGWSVCVNYRHDGAAAQRVVDRIVDGGGTAVAVRADVTDEDDVRQLFDVAMCELNTITMLVNNAGTTGGLARIIDLRIEQADEA